MRVSAVVSRRQKHHSSSLAPPALGFAVPVAPLYRDFSGQEKLLKAKIVYFSQTGNTRKVAQAMVEAMNAVGCAASAVPLSQWNNSSGDDYDLLGVGAPSFSSQAPTPVKRLIKNLPALHGKSAFVFSTSGGAPGTVLYDMAAALKKKGARVSGGFLCRGECFHPAPEIYGRAPGRPDENDLENARSFARSAVENLCSGGASALVNGRQDALAPRYGFYW
ncbi:MAG TPA: hypothetical protein ENN21_09815, partial [Spirochaetes bacterium]|nr:hypothetical protein [Spirochaetota bacterium]